MELKKWKKYTIYLVAILGYIICLEMFYKLIKTQAFTSFTPLVFSGVFSFLIGMLFAIEHVIAEIRKSGTWKINLAKIIFCVLPLFFFATCSLIYYLVPPIWIYPGCLYGLFQYFVQDIFIESIAQVLLGYTLITSFYKAEKKQKAI